jgi:hypothetical protein
MQTISELIAKEVSKLASGAGVKCVFCGAPFHDDMGDWKQTFLASQIVTEWVCYECDPVE